MKVVRCREIGFECDGVIRAETKREAIRRMTCHAKVVHGLDKITKEVLQKILAVMEDDYIEY
jgi:predicted small metal-binding protein